MNRVFDDPPPFEPSANGHLQARKKAEGRFALLNAFVDFGMAGLNRREVAVWLVLYRDARNGVAQTSYDGIAQRAGCDRRHVSRALRRLEELGLVEVVRRGGLNQGASSYRVCPPPLKGRP
jgi:predicted transcriptional regulator